MRGVTPVLLGLLAGLLPAAIGAPSSFDLVTTGTNGPSTVPAFQVHQAASFTYDVPTLALVGVDAVGAAEASSALIHSAWGASASLSVEAGRTSTTPALVDIATEAGGARFVVNSAGEALDTARITIPNGKFGGEFNR